MAVRLFYCDGNLTVLEKQHAFLKERRHSVQGKSRGFLRLLTSGEKEFYGSEKNNRFGACVKSALNRGAITLHSCRIMLKL